MPLVVTVESGPGGKRRFEVHGTTGAIGRDASCAVILDDPERHVSRVHCNIVERDGGYFLTINSKINSVLVNGRAFRFGQTTQLQDKDTILIPPFELKVALSSGSAPATLVAGGGIVSPKATPGAAVPISPISPVAPLAPRAPASTTDWFADGTDFSRTASGDPLGVADLVHRAPPPAPLGPDPFAQAAVRKTGLVDGVAGLTGVFTNLVPQAANPLVDIVNAGATGMFKAMNTPAAQSPSVGGGPLGLSPVGGAGTGSLSALGLNPVNEPSPLSALLAPAPSGNHALAGGGGGSSIDAILGIGGGSALSDPLGLGALGGFGGGAAGGAAPVSVLAPAPTAGGLVDFGHHAQSGSAAIDHVHDVNLPFVPPAVVGRQAASAPLTSVPAKPAPAIAPQSFGPAHTADSIDDLLAGLDGLSAMPTAAPLAPVAPAPSPISADAGEFIDLSDGAWPTAVTPAPFVSPLPEDIFAEDTFPGNAAVKPVVAAMAMPVAAPVATPVPVVVVPLAAPVAAPSPSAVDAALVAAFLEGVGLTDIKIRPEEQVAFMKLAGEIVGVSVAGVIGLLVARSEMKKELRADERTMLASQNNNPLKLMSDTGEAMSYLFDPSARAFGKFLPPVQAVADACADLQAHELAMVAGVRAAVEGSIKRFAPATLEKQFEKKLKGGLLTNRNAKMWEAYLEYYAKLDEDMTDNLDRIFERDFLSAYTLQVKQLRKP